jgi:hypothetical protein
LPSSVPCLKVFVSFFSALTYKASILGPAIPKITRATHATLIMDFFLGDTGLSGHVFIYLVMKIDPFVGSLGKKNGVFSPSCLRAFVSSNLFKAISWNFASPDVYFIRIWQLRNIRLNWKHTPALIVLELRHTHGCLQWALLVDMSNLVLSVCHWKIITQILRQVLYQVTTDTSCGYWCHCSPECYFCPTFVLMTFLFAYLRLGWLFRYSDVHFRYSKFQMFLVICLIQVIPSLFIRNWYL